MESVFSNLSTSWDSGKFCFLHPLLNSLSRLLASKSTSKVFPIIAGPSAHI